MPRALRTVDATRHDARARLATADAYLEVAGLVLDDASELEMANVAASLAVLAGIAGSDAMCACRLGRIHRGDDHRAASALLERATPDGKALAQAFTRLIDLKDQAHYGVDRVPVPRARNAIRWASSIAHRAHEEFER